jgi:DNA polymerase-3 subunit gamma/tau
MSQPYLVLARKYRPQTFHDVVHQEIPINAIKNALKHNRVGHAYIFFGPRGVGKTTIARILAKRLNCEHPIENEPCNECHSCVEITRGISTDVIEIDAATNRRIENIRDLKESVQFSPMGGKYKVYIIDEFHMLTTEAFNALLKTLEEPPAHVVFILATTDLHKVPETILSRCQDFVFQKVSTALLEEYIEKLCKIENYEYDREGLFWIAKKGDGSVRDTLSFMEQAVTFTDGKLTGSLVGKMIGYRGIQTFQDLLRSLIEERNSQATLLILETIFTQGIDLKKFLWDYLDFIHSSILLKENIVSRESINFSIEDSAKMQSFVKDYRMESLLLISDRVYSMYDKLINARLRNSYEIKVFFEIQFRKLFYDLSKPSIAGILAKIGELGELVQKDLNHLPVSKPENTVEVKPTTIVNDVEGSIKDTFSGVEVDEYPDIE